MESFGRPELLVAVRAAGLAARGGLHRRDRLELHRRHGVDGGARVAVDQPAVAPPGLGDRRDRRVLPRRGGAGRTAGRRAGGGRRRAWAGPLVLLVFGAPNRRPRGPAVVAAMIAGRHPAAPSGARRRGRAQLHAVLRRDRGRRRAVPQGAGPRRAQRRPHVPRVPLPAPQGRGGQGAVHVAAADGGARGAGGAVRQRLRGAHAAAGGDHQRGGRRLSARLRAHRGRLAGPRGGRRADRRRAARHLGGGRGAAAAPHRAPRPPPGQRDAGAGRPPVVHRLRVRRDRGHRPDAGHRRGGAALVDRPQGRARRARWTRPSR